MWLDALAHVVSDLGIEVLGKATSGLKGLSLVTQRQPDVLVTGVMMPKDDLDGIELVRRSLEVLPDLRAIVLSVYDDTDHIDAALAAGAVAYVVNTAHPGDVRSVIRQAFVHSVYLPSARPGDGSAPHVVDGNVPHLTRRELEILRMVAEGQSNTQVAKLLWVTEQTVKFHLSNVYRKLGVANRTEACRWAERHGLLGAPTEKGAIAAGFRVT